MYTFFTQTHISKILFASSIVLLLLGVPVFTVAAETVLRTGDSVTIASDQTVEEDFYALGGTVVMSGEIVGDMYSVGGSVTVNGSVTEDLSALGGSVQVHGPVQDDIRVIGGDVTIADTVEGDVFVISGSLNILSSAAITGDVFFYGGEVEINGPVTGSVMGTAGRFRIDSEVSGNVEVNATRELVLGERAAVSGNVSYQSTNEIVRAQNAVIEGSIIRNEAEAVPARPDYRVQITFFLVNLFAVLVVYLVFRKELEQFVRDTVQNYARSSVLGLAAVFIAPIVAVLLLVTVLGLLLGLIGLFALLTLYFVAFTLLSVVVGGMLAKISTKHMQVNFIWISIGVLVVHVLFAIPIIGPVAVFFGFVVVLGGLIWRGYTFLR